MLNAMMDDDFLEPAICMFRVSSLRSDTRPKSRWYFMLVWRLRRFARRICCEFKLFRLLTLDSGAFRPIIRQDGETPLGKTYHKLLFLNSFIGSDVELIARIVGSPKDAMQPSIRMSLSGRKGVATVSPAGH